MYNIQTLLAIFIFISIGYISKQFKVVDVDTAKKLIKFLFFLPLPILVLLSFATTKIDSQLFIFPVLAVLISTILIAISYLLGKALKFNSASMGTFIAAAGVTSSLLFALPFVQSFYGQENLKYLFMYDLGNGLMAWTVIYYITGLFGNKKQAGIVKGLVSFFKNPMLYALIIGLAMGLLGVQLPDFFVQLKSNISGLANPLLLIIIGVLLDFSYFTDKKNLLKLVLSAGVAMGVSVLLAYFLTSLFGISGIPQKIVLVTAISPAASLAVAFSVEHGLDEKYAAAIVAFTMVLGVILVPLVIVL